MILSQYRLNRSATLLICGASLGFTVISFLAMYFRRRKKRKNNFIDLKPIKSCPTNKENAPSTPTSLNDKRRQSKRHMNITSLYTFNKGLQSDTMTLNFGSSCDKDQLIKRTSNYNPLQEKLENESQKIRETKKLKKSSSFDSSKSDLNSSVVTIVAKDTNFSTLEPPQLLEAGMDLLIKAQNRWLKAFEKINQENSNNNIFSEEQFRLRAQLSQLIDLANEMKGCCSNELLSNICADTALDAALDEMDKEYEIKKQKYLNEENSDLESFYSAVETVDLSDLEEHMETFQHFTFYEEGLQQLQEGNVYYRCLRTKQVDCNSDTEFLAKLYCLRKAFHRIFESSNNVIWFENLGRDLVSQLLSHAEKDSGDFVASYRDLMDFVKRPGNWNTIEQELKLRNVKVMSFYDIVIDFLLFDAFDDLESAPQTIVTLVQNRWITNDFKKSAILTFVWSVLKAKRAMLKHSNGFMAKFYSISEITSPILAWGFLGPEGPLKTICLYFKDQVMVYVRQLFDFDEVRYTSLKHLSDDIMRVSKVKGQKIRDKMATPISLWA